MSSDAIYASPGPTPHCHRVVRGVADARRAANSNRWPPPGWGHGGLIDHRRRHNRTMALLKALTGPRGDEAVKSVAEMLDAERGGLRSQQEAQQARERELAQFGRNLAQASLVLREATDRVLELIGDDQTAEIPKQRATA